MAEASSNNGQFQERLKNALLSVKKQKARLQQLEAAPKEPIAIVGIGCRFPGGAHSPHAFWDKLASGFDAIQEVPGDRWNQTDHFDPIPQTPGKLYTHFGAFLEKVDCFDPHFFRISAREAISMDPQQRILLEVAWEALEDAAIDPTTLQGSRTGVFVGLTVVDYAQLLTAGDPRRMDTYFATGNVANMASGRLAYFFGFNGPSITVDTACSSSLIGTHQACQSLRTGDADMALAAGVNLILTPDNSIAISQARMLAPDGRCKTFDASADGYSRGEGCGVVVLKRLSDALADNDRIYATILGSAIGQDGASSGLTVPHGPSQESIITQSLANANLGPGDVGYIEAHGTGTALGDPIEMDALNKAYRTGHSQEKPLLVGSLKSNLGHMESAAGIGGVIKTALTVYHGQVPAHLNVTTVNPSITLEDIPAIIPQTLTPWPQSYEKRIAGVSSFGSSGSIGHILIGNHTADPMPHPLEQRPAVFVLSAKNEERLHALAKRYLEFLENNSAINLHNLCATLATGRSHFENRLAIATTELSDIQNGLTAVINKTEALPEYVFLGSRSNATTTNDSQSLANNYVNGAVIDWATVYPLKSFNKLSLPTYPFEQKRFWVDDLLDNNSVQPNSTTQHTLLGDRLPSVAGDENKSVWQRTLSISDFAEGWNSNPSNEEAHTLQATPYLKLFQAASQELFPTHTHSVKSFSLHQTICIQKRDTLELQLVSNKTTHDNVSLKIYTRPALSEAPWTLQAEATACAIENQDTTLESKTKTIDFGVMFFNGTERPGTGESYRLIQEATQFADYHNFSSVWIPERHFTEFGGIYANPSVMHAALAQSTQQIKLMAGSVVLPLHKPQRIAEEWAMVDNLSNGRVGISFASGWHPNDFTLAPENYEERHSLLFEGIADVQKLWRGESITASNGLGQEIEQRIHPTPVQAELPLWITAAANPKTFASAGRIGANLLTHLLDHDISELAEKIALYRSERAKHGHDPASGRVTVMLHSFLGDNHDTVRQIVKPPFTQFLKENIHLLKGLAASRGQEVNIEDLQGDSLDEFVSFVFDRFYDSRALLGTPESSLKMVDELIDAGVDEIACLLDFGPSTDDMLGTLPKLLELKNAYAPQNAKQSNSIQTFDALIADWKNRDLAITPSAADATTPQALDHDALTFIPSWQTAELTASTQQFAGQRWLLCGEPTALAEELIDALENAGAKVYTTHYRLPMIPHEPGAGAIDFSNNTECNAFIQEITQQGSQPLEGVIFLSEAADSLENGFAQLNYTINQKMMAVARILESLHIYTPENTTKIWTVTQGAQAILENESGDPVQAMMMSLAKVIPIEHSNYWGGFLDLDNKASSAEQVEQTLNGISNQSGEDRIAVRQNKTFIQRLTRSSLDSNHTTTPISIKTNKNYLITGGAGGLGLTIANWLVEQGATHITLIGRRSEDAITLPTPLIESSATVVYHSIDISDAAQVQQFASNLKASDAPALAGIYHTAGLWEDCPIELLDAAKLKNVLEPKVHGTWNLYRTFAQEPLEFIHLFSAFSSIMPAHGQGNYAAANGFLDAFAHYASNNSIPVKTINWGPWSEVGFASSAIGQRAHAQLESFGIKRFTPDQGTDLLKSLLNTSLPQTCLIAVDWKTFFKQDPQAALMPLLAERVSESCANTRTDSHASETLTALNQLSSNEAQIDRLLHTLKQLVAKALRETADTLPTDQSLLHLGVDSLIAVQLKNSIEPEIGLSLPIAKILEGPTLQALATDLLARLKLTNISKPSAQIDDQQALEEIEI